MVCTWRPLLEKFCILLWQARVGREIERYKREREEEMRKEKGGMTRAPSMILHHTALKSRGKVLEPCWSKLLSKKPCS
jgi:hypothetical protein